jgi:type IV pilus assembly protein PilM
MKAKVSKIAVTLQQWLTRGPRSTIGIDIGSGVLKIAEIGWHKNIPTLRAAGMTALPDDWVRDGIIIDKTALVETIRRQLATAGITGTHAIISVSGHSVFIRELTFPAMTNEELRQAIKWDLDKYVPTNTENYYYDFSVIGADQELHEVRVLLVAAPQFMIDSIIAICKEVGLKAIAIEIEPLAVYRAIKNEANTLVVDIGQKICQISIFQNNCPVVSRIIPLGGVRYTEEIMRSLELGYGEAELHKEHQLGLLQAATNELAESHIHKQLMLIVEELGREIHRTADYYQAQNREAIIENIILTGGGAQLDNLLINLATLLAGIEVKLIDPLADLEISRSLDPGWLNSIAPQLTVAVGLALRGGANY